MPNVIHTETLPSGYSFDMIRVEGGVFDMGGQDEGAYGDEKPVHQVRVSSFYLGRYPVTQALWKAVMGENNNPSDFKGFRHPVETVSWHDALDFIKKLNDQTADSRGAQGLGDYRLPTEAEWEYAARGGPSPEGYLCAGSDKLKEVGWYEGNSNIQTQDVGLLMGNELGFYDLSGNVWEWVEDRWHDDYKGAPTDGSTWFSNEEGAARVVRGGSYLSVSRDCRVACRLVLAPGDRHDNIGFRLALSPGTVGQSFIKTESKTPSKT